MDKKGKHFHSSDEESTKVILKEEVEKSEEEAEVETEKKVDAHEAEKAKRLKEKNSKKLEKMLKKKQRREEKSNRAVLSYEDLPLDEREKKKKKASVKLNKKRVFIAIFILVLVAVLVFAFANSDKLSWHNITNFVQYGVFNMNSDQHFPVSVQGENITPGNFARMGQDVCYASDTKVQILNNYGKVIFTSQHSYTSPVLSASSEYSLIYNLGGKGYQVNSRDQNLYNGVAEHNILVGDIVNNGTYAIVTQSDGYLSKLYVYDKDNNQIFAYSFASYYVTSVSLNSSGKFAVVSGLSAHNGSEISCVYVLDFTKDTPVYMQEYSDNIIYKVQYLNDTYACVIANNCASSLNTRTGEVNTTEYDGKTLTAFDVNGDTDTFSISLSRSGDGRNCEILSFATSGKLADSFTLNDKVISLSTYKNRVAALSPDYAYLYTKGGKQMSKKDSGNEPYSIVLFTSSDAYIMNTSEILTISL